jgi:hypothetical protein
MLPEGPKLRTVIWQPLFEQELQQLGFDAVRADEFTEGAEWVLSRYPDAGTKLAKNVWFLPVGRPSLGLSLYYTYDENNVYFLSMKRAPKDVE